MTSLSDLFRIALKIGLLSFGGPAAQIALMHRVYVEEKGWLSEAEFLRALSLCMLLPGPEAMQLATYTGWRLHGVRGGLISGGLFVLPGAIVILALAHLYLAFGDMPATAALFVGIKACVVVVVLEALRRLAARAFTDRTHLAMAVGAFIAIFAFQAPFPLVILVAACLGMVLGPRSNTTVAPEGSRMNLRAILGNTLPWLLLWAAPVALAAALAKDRLVDIGLFFSKLAVVTFGGAYAVLTYMTQEVVLKFGWLSTEQMIDALGLAETTPGPLILVTEFVGILAGGTVGGLMTLWVTFVPCFLWIFALAPFVESLADKPRLSQALAGVTAAVVGVIANLSIWFALHVFFDQVTSVMWAAGKLPVPQLDTFRPLPFVLAGLAALLLIPRKMPLPLVLGICAGLSLVWTLASGEI